MMNDQAAGAGRPMTEGEYRVGVTFNPSKNPTVDTLKAQAAAFIDSCIAIRDEASGREDREVYDLADRAARAAEGAAMWAVKAATKQPR